MNAVVPPLRDIAIVLLTIKPVGFSCGQIFNPDDSLFAVCVHRFHDAVQTEPAVTGTMLLNSTEYVKILSDYLDRFNEV
jgi:hypothetical protein